MSSSVQAWGFYPIPTYSHAACVVAAALFRGCLAAMAAAKKSSSVEIKAIAASPLVFVLVRADGHK